jgi:hypothetical protein
MDGLHMAFPTHGMYWYISNGLLFEFLPWSVLYFLLRHLRTHFVLSTHRTMHVGCSYNVAAA